MIELTGIGSIFRGMSFLYWLLAIGALALVTWKVKRWTYKAIGIAVVVGISSYLPAQAWQEMQKREAYGREAWAYFKKLCDEKSGEKIYKTFTGVKSVLVIKPLPPATDKDLYDQFWYGDPYSNANTYKRAESVAINLVLDWAHRSGKGTQQGLEFVEMKEESGEGYIRIHRPMSSNQRAVRQSIQEPVSKFGVAWEDISTPNDRKHWVAASRLRVIDMTDKSVVAERIGYLIEAGFGSRAGQRTPWQTSRGIGPNGRSCPPSYDPSDQWFLTSVFKQNGEK